MQDPLVRTAPTPEVGGGLRLDLSRIAQDLQIRKVQVESVVQLLDEGNTVPFITRYRKERTGGLDEEDIRTIQQRVGQLRQLAERKQTILKSIEGQGKLTDELRQAILAADTPKRLEDLYLPYKPKKTTLASKARERGLEPLALAIWTRDPAVANLPEILPTLVNPERELNTPEEVLLGVQHILAEMMAETADVRAAVRSVLWETGKLCTSKHEKLADNQGLEYKDYFQFTESIRTIPPHRILAINRGEKENALHVRLEWDVEAVQRRALERLPVPAAPPVTGEVAAPAPGGNPPPAAPLQDHPHADFLRNVLADALARLLLPSLEREIRRELTNVAEDYAVKVFARNLRNLLLQPPLYGRRILAIDPGFRTGCKVACVDETGNLLEDTVIFPHQPQNRKEEARAKLEELVRKHHIHVVAIGNGTACRETEELVSELIARLASPPPPEATPPAPEPAPAPTAVVTAEAPPAPAPTEEAPPAPAPEPVPSAVVTTPEVSPPPPEAAAVPAPETTEQPAASPAPETAPAAPSAESAQPAPEPAAAAPTGEANSTAPVPAPVAEAAPPVAPLSREPMELAYVIVNEAGASVYSASAVGREEFPNFDATLRGTISIGRRLQDPLSEYVKIDPQNIGVGLYQHDVSPRQLKDSLDAVIESCVNYVGVDLNTASVPLLRYVSGLNQLTARELVEYRKQHGPFRSREQLLEVPGIGPARYVQAAGFLKIFGENPLDRTWIHPESYPVALQLLAEVNCPVDALAERQRTEEVRDKLKALSPEEVSNRLQVGVPTIRDIIEALSRPGRDPREDLPPPIFKKGILKLEDLQPGMELKGTVLNVVPFGAFVDIGLKDSGLVHISQMANRYVKSPDDVVAVGDVVTVWVLSVDQERRRVSLTMIRPGTERKPPEKRPAGEGRPAGERRPVAAGGGGPGGERRGPGAGPGRRGEHRRPGPPGGQARQPQGQRRPPPRQVATPTGEAGATPGSTAGTGAQGGQRTPAQPPPRPRKPGRPTPKPKLTQSALEGETPLRTFGELKAFFEARRSDDNPPPPAPPTPPATPPPSEEPPKE